MKNIESLFLQEKLLQEGIISARNLPDIAELQEKEDISFVAALLKLELASEEKVVSFLIKIYSWPFVEIDKYKINKEIAALLPKEIATKHNMVLLDKVGSIYCAVVSQPLEEKQDEEIKQYIKGNVCYMVSLYSEVSKRCNSLYS